MKAAVSTPWSSQEIIDNVMPALFTVPGTYLLLPSPPSSILPYTQLRIMGLSSKQQNLLWLAEATKDCTKR